MCVWFGIRKGPNQHSNVILSKAKDLRTGADIFYPRFRGAFLTLNTEDFVVTDVEAVRPGPKRRLDRRVVETPLRPTRVVVEKFVSPILSRRVVLVVPTPLSSMLTEVFVVAGAVRFELERFRSLRQCPCTYRPDLV